MDRARIKSDMMALADIGKQPQGGISRVFGTEYMKECQQAALKYVEAAGMKGWIDTAGNVHGLYQPEGAEGKEILSGSHIDTVKEGGVFDGLMGFVAAVESVRLLQENCDKVRCPIHVIGTNGEEGNDLGGTFGSRAMMGLLDLEDEAYLKKCASFGYSREDLQNAILDTAKCKCWLEAHIEQGKTLYEEKEQIGIVNGIVGLYRYGVRITGEANHAGTTMMEYRKDALVAASAIIVEADRLAREFGNQMVATVANVQVFPGATAVVPGGAEFVLEFRNLDQDRLELFMETMKQNFAKVAPNVKVETWPVVKKPPVRCSDEIIAVMEKHCAVKKDLKYRVMSSGATHDGNAMALRMPIGMLFVPSKDGISHNPNEWTEWDDVYQSIELLYETIKDLAQ